MLVVAHVVGQVGDVKFLAIAKKSLLKWEVNWQCHVIIWTHRLQEKDVEKLLVLLHVNKDMDN
jgi:hypothetical protein